MPWRMFRQSVSLEEEKMNTANMDTPPPKSFGEPDSDLSGWRVLVLPLGTAVITSIAGILTMSLLYWVTWLAWRSHPWRDHPVDMLIAGGAAGFIGGYLLILVACVALRRKWLDKIFFAI